MHILHRVARWAVIALATGLAAGCKTPPAQTKFSTEEMAARALHEALKAEDPEKLNALIGREWMAAAASGDAVADQHAREVIALAMDQSWRWTPRDDHARELIIGDEQWPFPIPLVQAGDQWRFDSVAGMEEVLFRRIGGNELGAIRICRDYVRSQEQYASQPHDGKPRGVFAQRFRSTPGKEDGLFWERKRGDGHSPLGELVASAVAEGYDPNKPDESPFRGYRFRILTAQGPTAPGGPKNYVANVGMTGGFGLLAFPVKYASSGVMTFVVGPDGVVYQKDLGRDTARLATRLVDFNPDETWTPVPTP